MLTSYMYTITWCPRTERFRFGKTTIIILAHVGKFHVHHHMVSIVCCLFFHLWLILLHRNHWVIWVRLLQLWCIHCSVKNILHLVLILHSVWPLKVSHASFIYADLRKTSFTQKPIGHLSSNFIRTIWHHFVVICIHYVHCVEYNNFILLFYIVYSPSSDIIMKNVSRCTIYRSVPMKKSLKKPEGYSVAVSQKRNQRGIQ